MPNRVYQKLLQVNDRPIYRDKSPIDAGDLSVSEGNLSMDVDVLSMCVGDRSKPLLKSPKPVDDLRHQANDLAKAVALF